MQMELVLRGENEEEQAELEDDNTAAMAVHLWKPDAITAVVEVDRKLAVVKADHMAGLICGVEHKAMLKKSFIR